MQDERAGRRSPQVQGPRGPGSPKVEGHQEHPSPERQEIPAPGGWPEERLSWEWPMLSHR